MRTFVDNFFHSKSSSSTHESENGENYKTRKNAREAIYEGHQDGIPEGQNNYDGDVITYMQ